MINQVILANAIGDGLGDIYRKHEEFREVYDQQFNAIASLPSDLIERGLGLHYPQLHSACLLGDSELVNALLALGLGPDIYTNLNDDEDDTPLEWLADASDMDFEVRCQIAKILIAAGAYMDEALFRASNIDDEAFADFLRSHGAEDES